MELLRESSYLFLLLVSFEIVMHQNSEKSAL